MRDRPIGAAGRGDGTLRRVAIALGLILARVGVGGVRDGLARQGIEAALLLTLIKGLCAHGALAILPLALALALALALPLALALALGLTLRVPSPLLLTLV